MKYCFFIICILVALSILNVAKATVLSTCQSTSNAAPCQCSESTSSWLATDGCSCDASGYNNSQMTCASATKITCASQCGNGALHENTASDYWFKIYQPGVSIPSNCSSCGVDNSTVNYRTCYEVCDTGPGTMGLYTYPGTTCCPRNCGWNGRQVNSTTGWLAPGTPVRQLNGVYDRFNLVPKQCYTPSDCDSAPGWTIDCVYDQVNFGWCRYSPLAGTLPAASSTPTCPTLPCMQTFKVGTSCTQTVWSDYINSVYNTGTGYYPDTSEAGYYCEMLSSNCWSTPSCYNGALRATPTLRSFQYSSSTVAVQCNTNMPINTFIGGAMTFEPAGTSMVVSSLKVSSTTCPTSVNISITNGQIYFSGLGSSSSCTVFITFNSTCFQKFIVSKTVSLTCCGDGTVTSNEVCDTGLYVGYAVNNSCCLGCSTTNVSLLTPPLITAKKCVTNTDCNDNTANTADTCVNGWCSNKISGIIQISKTTCASNPCLPDIPCYTKTCSLSGDGVACNYGFPTDNIALLSQTACKVEDVCHHTIACVNASASVAYRTYLTPSFTLTGLTVPSQRCNTGLYLNVSAVVQTTWSSVSSHWGTPSTTVQLVQVGTCALTPTITGSLVAFNGTWNYSLPSTCQFNYTVTSFCGDSKSITISIPIECCGDGTTQSGSEQCDLGVLNGQFGYCCSSLCRYMPNAPCRLSGSSCDGGATCLAGSTTCPASTPLSSLIQCFTAYNDCTVNRTCDGISLLCPSGFKPSGSSCNVDGNLCTQDACNGGGSCILGPLLSYDDGQFCNGPEGCNATTGLIIPGIPPDCSDNNSCTNDACCEISNACYHIPIANSTGQCGVSNVGACLFGNYVCNGTGPTPVITCEGAVYPSTELCVPALIDENCDGLVDEGCTTIDCTSDINCTGVQVSQCSESFCNASNVCDIRPKAAGTTCDDGLGCTTGDNCDGNGGCSGIPLTCSDNGNTCVLPYCTEPNGICQYNLGYYMGSSCDCDPGSCLQGCTCNNQGHCGGGVATTCPPTNNQCVTAFCDTTIGGVCNTQNILGACNDGLDCTQNDQCINGTCAGILINVNDGLVCTLDSCIEPGGVITHTLISGYCFIDGICYSDNDVNPTNPCQLCNSSHSTSTWSFTTQLNVPCNDGLRCTLNDTCQPITQTCTGELIDCSSFSNECNTGYCSETSGTCAQLQLQDGTPCIDLEFCVVSKQCQAGTCSGGVPRDCSLSDSQCTIGVCNETLDSCESIPLPDNTRCYLDNNFCNGQEVCLSGDCVYGETPVSPPNGTCYYYLCDPSIGFVQVITNGQPCNDSNPCTTNDTCSNTGTCDPGSPLDCNDNDPCTDDMCNTTMGCIHVPIPNCQACNTEIDCSFQTCHTAICNAQNQCEYTPVSAGTSCGNCNVCDGIEVCGDTGTCLGGIPLNCTSDNPCVDSFCDNKTGCYTIPNPSNTFTLNDPCLINPRCSDTGIPLSDPYPCPDPDACHTYSCQNIDGQPVCVATILVNNVCNDLNECTYDDKCNIFGNCDGTPIECPPPNQCEVSVDCTGGVCVPVYKDLGTPCDNGDLCFENICDGAGSCVNGDPIVTCQPIGDCYGPGTCIDFTGTCTTPLLSDGTPCPFTSPCVLSAQCQQGSCNAVDIVQCTSSNFCETNCACNDTLGQCVCDPVPNNTPCTSGDACASLSVCIDRVCTNTDFIDCSSTNPCVDTSCDSQTGCVESFNQNPCNNTNKCFENYQCTNGDCPTTSGTPVDCDDGNSCTHDECYAQIGCVHSAIVDCYTCSINGTGYTGASECPVLPCKKAYCGSDNTCYYVNDDTNIVGCQDNIFCNGQEGCSNGQCIHTSLPSCEDNNGCTIDFCDLISDACMNIPAVGQQCGLPDMCVYEAQCGEVGTCDPVTTVECTPPTDECQYLIGCDSSTGQCLYVDAPDGMSCVPINTCAASGSCLRGICEVASLKPCDALDQCHLPGTCNPLTANCSNPAKPDFSSCDDGLNCTLGDECISGDCASGTTNYCDSIVIDEQCQSINCVETENGPACLVTNLDGLPCDDGIPFGVCTKQTICSGGMCVREYNVGEECGPPINDCDLPEYCIAEDDCPTDLLRTNGHPCSDNLYCYDSTCQDGACIPTIQNPPPPSLNPCTQFVCDESQQAFVQVNLADGTLCNTDAVGQCIDHFECLTGTCVLIPKPNTTSCCDGNNCTIGDKCSGTSEVCISGGPKDCSSLNTQCSTGVCLAPNGTCSTQAANEGGLCNADDNPCTPFDTCRNQVCIPGAIKNCTYLNSPCTIGQCQVYNTTYGVCYAQPTGDACNPDSCVGGCVLSYGYWSTHDSREKSITQRIPWPFGAESTMLCGQTWYFWSQQKSSTNAWIKLFDQWVAATLNKYIGACMPPSVTTTYNLATLLLSQCNTGILTSSLASGDYKKYAAVLEAYDSGTISPQSCTTKYLTSTTARDVIVVDEGVDDTYPLDTLFQNIVQPEFCINGNYDFLTSLCNCYYGWGSPTCSECGVPDETDHTYLCVPTTTGNPPYLLQSINNTKLDQYLTKSLAILQLSSLTPVYPGTNDLDCSCGSLTTDNVNARDVIDFSIYTSQDTTVIISYLQEEFGECQTIFDTEILIINNTTNCTEANQTIIYVEIETSDDEDDEDLDFDVSDDLWWVILLGVGVAIVVVLICIYFFRRSSEPEIIGQQLYTPNTHTGYSSSLAGNMHDSTRDYEFSFDHPKSI